MSIGLRETRRESCGKGLNSVSKVQTLMFSSCRDMGLKKLRKTVWVVRVGNAYRSNQYEHGMKVDRQSNTTQVHLSTNNGPMPNQDREEPVIEEKEGKGLAGRTNEMCRRKL